VASEAGAHCRQPQQKVQELGGTLNMNFSSARGIGPCPSDIPGAPVPRLLFGLPGLTLDSARSLAPPDHLWTIGGMCTATTLLCSPAWVLRGRCPARGSLPATLGSHRASPLAAPWQGLPWGNVGKDALVLSITTPIGTPDICRLLCGMFPDYGPENLTFGQ